MPSAFRVTLIAAATITASGCASVTAVTGSITEVLWSPPAKAEVAKCRMGEVTTRSGLVLVDLSKGVDRNAGVVALRGGDRGVTKCVLEI